MRESLRTNLRKETDELHQPAVGRNIPMVTKTTPTSKDKTTDVLTTALMIGGAKMISPVNEGDEYEGDEYSSSHYQRVQTSKKKQKKKQKRSKKNTRKGGLKT
jgi:hypothetical protein